MALFVLLFTSPADAQFWKKKRKSGPVVSQPAERQSQNSVYLAFPTGDLDTSVVKVLKAWPKEVQLNRTFDYTITVTNLAANPIEDVVVEDQIPASYRFGKASPSPRTTTQNSLEWNLGKMSANSSRIITISGRPTSTASLSQCVNVTFRTQVCSTIKVVAPRLKLVQIAPSSALVCDTIPLKYVITNPGTGHVRGVTITGSLPPGLRTTGGQSKVVVPAGDLAPGRSMTHTVETTASRVGRYTPRATASSAGGIKAVAEETTTEVLQPILRLANASRKVGLMGQPVDFEITAFNSGNGTSAGTTVKALLPANATFLKSTAGTVKGNLLKWYIGALNPKENRTVIVTVKPTTVGTLSCTAEVSGICADSAKATASTRVTGIPAILLEVIDINDPVEVGGQEIYVITATNQGSIPETNVSVVVELEDTMQFVSATGDSGGVHRKGKVIFAPYSILKPKAKATWKVVVKAIRSGDVRFGVSMTSDQFRRPVAETEATNFYQ